MIVLKFGGTSVANSENIKKTIEIINQSSQQNGMVVVVSALGGITDLLLNSSKLAAQQDPKYLDVYAEIENRHQALLKELELWNEMEIQNRVSGFLDELKQVLNGISMLSEMTPRIMDRVLSFGEMLSSVIISYAINHMGTPLIWKDTRLFIKTDEGYGKAKVNFTESNSLIESCFENKALYLVPGFIASDSFGNTTTLGRGGSDYTASIIAAALQAEKLEIWTDVSGMMTADPRLCINAKIIPDISYREAMELSHFGAKVIYPPTIQPVMNKGIPVWIKNTFQPKDMGTIIQASNQQKGMLSENNLVTGISNINNISLITLEGSGMIGIPGFSKRFFDALSRESINVILITQSSSEHSISVGIDDQYKAQAIRVVNQEFEREIHYQIIDPLLVETDLSIVALVGAQMKMHSGISGKMFSALGRNGINIRAIAQGSSEMNISAVIQTHEARKAVNVLHEEFFETTYKQVNLFVAGTGNVGKKLIEQIQQQFKNLQDNLKIYIRIVGIINSKKMCFNESGVNLENWLAQLNAGEDSDVEKFIAQVRKLNLRNAIFIDVTANEQVAHQYESLLKKSISVVACNKIAASSNFESYLKLKSVAKEFNTNFLFETNVGAGLPIIGTINDLVNSGDVIHRMDAVLSGTLNFVFNEYDATKSFSETVSIAQKEGYTEPDPRLDLGGKDVMRKILILAREAGYGLEFDDIENDEFMPKDCMQGSVDDFYASMLKHESHFKNLYQEAAKGGQKLKFVASFKNKKAKVGLQKVDASHDFYHLYGKDNVVLFYTDRYYHQPLVIKGAGAGAEVTASGVFADIIRATKK